MPTKNEQAREKLSALLRARVALIVVVSTEEARVEEQIEASAKAANYKVRAWDCGDGLQEKVEKTDNGRTYIDVAIIDPSGDPTAPLAAVIDTAGKMVFVLRDFHAWYDPVTVRKLKNAALQIQNAPSGQAKTIIVLTHKSEIPPELSDLATVIDWPLPERGELAEILDGAVGVLKGEAGEKIRAGLVNGAREAAIDAATGLTGNGAGNAYALSLVQAKNIEASRVSEEKKRIVSRAAGLTIYDPDPRGFDAIGGLENVKSYLRRAKAALTPRARAFGLPPPKGIFLSGLSGCGKTFVAKCAGAALELPILRFDLGATKSKYVGESEAGFRRALAVVEAVAPCILVCDEIEKSLGGSTGPQGDGGVASDQLGALLTWMQDRQGSVIVIATANETRYLPPELTRKGRFDEMFFVDLPTARERQAILAASLRLYKRDPEQVGDLGLLEQHTRGFTGAEIAALVPDALFCAFAEGERDLTIDDLITSAASVVPMSKTQAEKVQGLRDWAKGRARPASLPEGASGATSGGRDLDLE